MTTDNACTQRPFDREALGRRALELHGMKYNCAQAVACTLAEGLGGGMGGLTETCGAVSGAAMAIGLANSNGQDDRTSKQATYRIVRKLVSDFREQNGSTLCPELKGIKTKQPLRSCDGCIVDALQLAADALAGLPADKPLDA